jgi:hypothetical protein
MSLLPLMKVAPGHTDRYVIDVGASQRLSYVRDEGITSRSARSPRATRM